VVSIFRAVNKTIVWKLVPNFVLVAKSLLKEEQIKSIATTIVEIVLITRCIAVLIIICAILIVYCKKTGGSLPLYYLKGQPK
jgi:hypothetical protein